MICESHRLKYHKKKTLLPDLVEDIISKTILKALTTSETRKLVSGVMKSQYSLIVIERRQVIR